MKRPFFVELQGSFHATPLYDARGKEIFDADEAVRVAEDIYGNEWESVYNGEYSTQRNGKRKSCRKNPSSPTDAEIASAARVIATIPVSVRPKNAWPAQYPDVAKAWKAAQARLPWIKANLHRMQGGVPARNMERALEMVPWENTVDDWQRLMEYRLAKNLRARAKQATRKNPE